jgi:hypothetical protein
VVSQQQSLPVTKRTDYQHDERDRPDCRDIEISPKTTLEPDVSEALEHHDHAEHAATPGSKRAALLIAVLAALLAIAEQQGRHAEIRVSINSIFAADAWSQYQAKST